MSTWQKRDVPANCFLLPREVFQLGLTRGALLVYLYLVYRKYLKHGSDELTHAAIGKAVGLCVKTVRAHLHALVTRELIAWRVTAANFCTRCFPFRIGCRSAEKIVSLHRKGMRGYETKVDHRRSV